VGWFIALLAGPAYAIKYLGGTITLWAAFVVSFLLCLWMVPLSIMSEFHRYHDFLTLPGLLAPTLFSVQAAVYGMAFWTLWKQKPSAKLWGMVASLTYIVLPLLTIWSKIHFSRSIRGCSMAVLVVGVAGLVVFSRRTINYPFPTEQQRDT